MQEEEKKYEAWGIDEGTHEATGLKPMLNLDEQIDFLASKGVKFERCDAEAALSALSSRNTFLHITSFRKLFQTYQRGPKTGLYVDLDFADLLYLNGLDATVRSTFLRITQDIERMAKAKLMYLIETNTEEDGYGIVADFMATQQKRFRNSIESNMKARMNVAVEGDEYTGGLIRRYADAMPAWVFLEVVTFGTLLSFYLFCADRWEDKEIKEEHYILKGVKALRNCCSHGSCIINGFDSSRDSTYLLSSVVYEWLAKHGYKNTKTRRSKLRNRRIQQLLETLVMFERLDSSGECTRTRESLAALSAELGKASERYTDRNGFVSYLRFLASLIDNIS